jgi:hemerythrin-like domain-containing protein
MNSAPAAASSSSPVDDFSQCHAGILGQLNALDTLPALLGPAARARKVAADVLGFFRDAVFEHHAEEEAELFPAVLASATAGAERDQVQALVTRLTGEHRRIEAGWTRLEPRLKAVSKGHEADLDGAEVSALVQQYREHARFEEEVFLPLSQAVLGRNSNHLAALGVSLHLRHAMPQVLERFGSRL